MSHTSRLTVQFYKNYVNMDEFTLKQITVLTTMFKTEDCLSVNLHS